MCLCACVSLCVDRFGKSIHRPTFISISPLGIVLKPPILTKDSFEIPLS